LATPETAPKICAAFTEIAARLSVAGAATILNVSATGVEIVIG
jgi:hypothetical protein